MPFGVQMLGPVIYTFGNQEQKDWVLPVFCPVKTGGVRAIQSPARVPTLRFENQSRT